MSKSSARGGDDTLSAWGPGTTRVSTGRVGRRMRPPSRDFASEIRTPGRQVLFRQIAHHFASEAQKDLDDRADTISAGAAIARAADGGNADFGPGAANGTVRMPAWPRTTAPLWTAGASRRDS